MEDTTNWTYNGEEIINLVNQKLDDYQGFIYQITNLVDNRKYIGKKFFWSKKTKTIKGKKKRYTVESDWQTYYGSNAELQKDVILHGQDKFKREILHLCKTKGECGYLEAKEQFRLGVLESDEYYNSWIMVRVRKSHIKDYNARLSKTD